MDMSMKKYEIGETVSLTPCNGDGHVSGVLYDIPRMNEFRLNVDDLPRTYNAGDFVGVAVNPTIGFYMIG